MTTRIIIDGYNLLGLNGATALRDIEAEREDLITRLRAYKLARRADVTVVFDAHYAGRLSEGQERRSGVNVIFSKGGVDADTVIRRLSDERGAGLTVVTSDRALASYAQARGAVVVSSSEFAGLLEMAVYEDLKGVKPEDEEDRPREKKGQSKKPPKEERKKKQRLKKL